LSEGVDLPETPSRSSSPASDGTATPILHIHPKQSSLLDSGGVDRNAETDIEDEEESASKDVPLKSYSACDRANHSTTEGCEPKTDSNQSAQEVDLSESNLVQEDSTNAIAMNEGMGPGGDAPVKSKPPDDEKDDAMMQMECESAEPTEIAADHSNVEETPMDAELKQESGEEVENDTIVKQEDVNQAMSESSIKQEKCDEAAGFDEQCVKMESEDVDIKKEDGGQDAAENNENVQEEPADSEDDGWIEKVSSNI
jgi:hypothetical protein